MLEHTMIRLIGLIVFVVIIVAISLVIEDPDRIIRWFAKNKSNKISQIKDKAWLMANLQSIGFLKTKNGFTYNEFTIKLPSGINCYLNGMRISPTNLKQIVQDNFKEELKQANKIRVEISSALNEIDESDYQLSKKAKGKAK